MSASIRTLLSICLIAVLSPAAWGQTHLMRYADVHDDLIVFTYEDDLWLVSTDGGEARRITSDPGAETWAKFSPDGRWVAFSAEYDGDTDVFVMSVDGGMPKRLTFHPANDGVLGWFPDGKHIFFRSRREYPSRAEMIYKVSIDGGMPEKLPVDRAGLTALSPDATMIVYNRISRENRTWKRHQGGTAQDLWLGSLAKGDYHKITDWVGTDNYPMWEGDAIYFTSDRDFGTLNIFRYDVSSGSVTRLTDYRDYDVKFPSIGTGKIVYQYEEKLHLLDLATGESREVQAVIPSDRVRMRPELVDVEPRTGSFRLSPTGKRLVLDVRGEVVNVPVEDDGGTFVNVTDAPGSREKDAVWSPDGKWIAFFSDRTGEEELYLADPNGQEEPRRLTTGGMGFRRQPEWSPDGKWLMFSDKFLKLNLVNAETGAITVVDQGEYDDGWNRWGIQDYAWSPDSRWIAYSKLEQSLYESIFIYSLDDASIHRVTSEMTSDWSPTWDPKGRYLYFLSMRHFAPIMGFVDQNHIFLDMTVPHIVLLKTDEASPFAPKVVEEEVKESKETKGETADAASKGEGDRPKEDSAGEKKVESKKSDGVKVDIDFEGIGRRIIAAKGVEPGNYFRLEATDKGLLFLSRSKNQFEKYQYVDDGTSDRLNLMSYKLDDAETSEVLGRINNYHLSPDGKKLVYRAGSTYGVVDVHAKGKVGDGEVDLSHAFITVDRLKEFLQIFDEAWRVQRDWFYDPNMHGVDWQAMREKYRKLVPDCGNRGDLNYVIGEMISELNIGHTYVFGGDIERDARRVPIGLLGADFARDGSADYYRITRIYPGTPWDEDERGPLAEPGCGVREGDYLISIDGKEIGVGENLHERLLNKAGTIVTISYNDRPSAEGAKSCRIRTTRSEGSVRYRDWVERNGAFVDQASNGQIGYLHIPNMGEQGLIEFAKAFYPQYYKKGLIVDVRANGGGFTSRMIIDRLERELSSITKPREGKPIPDPERVFNGHLVVLLNEDTGSDGELFSETVKTHKLAPLIGMRTWGGAVGIELHQPLVDGGGTTPPQFGPYNLAGKWIIEGRGVEPDIEVQNMPGDVLKGIDAQLQAGIDNLRKRIGDDPRDLPPPPPYPDKSKPKS
ncbi:MAG: PD40 domain-containing protein [Phycisphaerae bacterium]|nr:PD40 domain-containing protein [Phycisphaerae bacterium]